jgi:succinyl-diaminopimelate desuccinylase
MNPALGYATELIRRSSVTPDDGGCQDYLESVLTPLGFTRQRVDAGDVTNSIYERAGELEGTLAFAGHTDVVPPGPLELWDVPPFEARVADNMLHGRGAQDMKGAIACCLAAIESLMAEGTPLPSLQLLITSDEEGESVDGTVRLVERLRQEKRLPDVVIVGEPSSSERVGDTIRRGRRGIVLIEMEFEGTQGHSAYPHEADNAIHHAAPVLARIASIDWGEPAENFPPTSCQITNVQGGTGATNVIPGTCRAIVDIRYNPANDFEDIQHRIGEACRGARVKLNYQHQGTAFYTEDGPWLDLVAESIRRTTGVVTTQDTGGGTSDGRFLAAVGVPVVELGLTNDTIHQINERVALDELETLTRIYADIIRRFGG